MNVRTFVLIIAMKLLAIQIIAIGIYCELRSRASVGELFITMGSLLFAIASNTTLFYVVNAQRKKKGGEKNVKLSVDENNFKSITGLGEGGHSGAARTPRNICGRA